MSKGKVLVTGASGFLGRRIVETLVEHGYPVSALVRKTSKVDNLKGPGVEISFGDVTDVSSLKLVFEGINFVIHTAADTSGTKEGARRVTIGGTRNILELCSKFLIQKLVYISSCSVYAPADWRHGQVIDETAPLEKYPERRGVYSWSKIEAEKLVLDYMERKNDRIVCLRPGTIYGPGGNYFTPMMGFSYREKVFVVISNGHLILPLVYIDNLVDAIMKAIECDNAVGKIYNVVDSDNPTKKEYVEALLKRIYPKSRFVYVPYRLLFLLVVCQQKLLKMMGRKTFLTWYRLVSSQKAIQFDTTRISSDLDWNQGYSFQNAVTLITAYENTEFNLNNVPPNIDCIFPG